MKIFITMGKEIEKTLQYYVNEFEREVSGTIDINKKNEMDIIHTLMSTGNEHQVLQPFNDIAFHTHPLSLKLKLKQQHSAITNGDVRYMIEEFCITKKRNYNIVVATEGIYVCYFTEHFANHLLGELELHSNNILEVVESKKEYYYDIADIVCIYNQNEKEIENCIRNVPPEKKEMFEQFLDKYKKGMDLITFKQEMFRLGIHIEFHPFSKDNQEIIKFENTLGISPKPISSSFYFPSYTYHNDIEQLEKERYY